AQPARAAAHDVAGVGAVDVVAVHVLPDFQEIAHAAAEIVGEHRQRGGVDRARRGAAEDRKRVPDRVAEDVAHRLDDADLIGGACAASSKYEACPGFHQKRVCSCPRGALASATASAVMLTMRRTVAEGVRICTGRAAPSRIGPMVTLSEEAILSRLKEMLAASSVGITSRLASPFILEFGNTLWRISSESAASPCISPSTSSSG